MFRRLLRIGVRIALVGIIVGLGYGGWQYTRAKQIRQSLYDAFEPVAVTNCELKRFGDANDGGYLLCGNLLAAAKVAYSYGINGADNWGCQVSTALTVPVHQYDCFNTTAPDCPGGDARFHAECVGPERSTFEGLPFDSVANQVSTNGDAGKRIVMKMDVEGSEWESLLKTPDAVLSEIDQMAVEFHEVEKPAFLATIERMKRFFYVAHVHVNNFKCEPGFEPFAGQVFEVLFVSKRLGQIDPSINARGASPLDAPNIPILPDCQESPSGGELTSIGRWTRRTLGVWYTGFYNDWKDRLLPPVLKMEGVTIVELEFDTGTRGAALLGDIASSLVSLDELLRDLASIDSYPSSVEFRKVEIVAIEMRSPMKVRLSLSAISQDAVRIFEQICRDIILGREQRLASVEAVLELCTPPGAHITDSEAQRLYGHVVAVKNAAIPLKRIEVTEQ